MPAHIYKRKGSYNNWHYFNKTNENTISLDFLSIQFSSIFFYLRYNRKALFIKIEGVENIYKYKDIIFHMFIGSITPSTA